MGIAVIPAPSAGGKTMYRTMLTGGSSYTVPANVTYLNVTLCGGGGGGGASNTSNNSGGGAGGGGTTTFTGATSAVGGNAGAISEKSTSSSQNQGPANGTSGTANTGQGGTAGRHNGDANATPFFGQPGSAGAVVSSFLSVTPGASIGYSIGGGGNGGTFSSYGANGGNGGSGYIIVEYWL